MFLHCLRNWLMLFFLKYSTIFLQDPSLVLKMLDFHHFWDLSQVLHWWAYVRTCQKQSKAFKSTTYTWIYGRGKSLSQVALKWDSIENQWTRGDKIMCSWSIRPDSRKTTTVLSWSHTRRHFTCLRMLECSIIWILVSNPFLSCGLGLGFNDLNMLTLLIASFTIPYRKGRVSEDEFNIFISLSTASVLFWTFGEENSKGKRRIISFLLWEKSLLINYNLGCHVPRRPNRLL